MQGEKQRISRFEVTRDLTEVKPQLFCEFVRCPCSGSGVRCYDALLMMLQLSGMHNHVQCLTPPLIVCLFLIRKAPDRSPDPKILQLMLLNQKLVELTHVLNGKQTIIIYLCQESVLILLTLQMVSRDMIRCTIRPF